VAIWEVVQPGLDEPAELLGDAFALFFRLSSIARCYTTTEYAGLLADAGFVDVDVQPFPLGRSLAVISAEPRNGETDSLRA